MQLNNWRDALTNTLPPHYFETSSDYHSKIMNILPEGMSGLALILKRTEKASFPGFRTILIACPESIESSKGAIHWAANVRDILPEPYSSDIYLFLDIENASLEDGNRLEADEFYCRKYVKRPNEAIENFLKRTFLALPVSRKQIDELSDPISTSLLKAAKQHQYLSTDQQKRWRNVLSSNDSAQEIVEALFELEIID
ncbi:MULTISPECIES: ABC-three component system middle component 1 [Vibrio]|uniref:ABC-three component system middle component 1 n=1 Tax=Vibrio TaxID=662 RepID=UPI000373A750|nr:ABC-three component system middle component 1 [Vibrio tasmaniensis]OEF78431.1 hypothetical protein A162_16380 [Vibrio tasmaniensis 1F-155]PMO78746.1 hypothetical protein BCT01_12020 [Vibrio tasmaniensis]